MAQTNFTPILLYASSTPTNVPSAGNLTNSATGSELAINIADKNLFFKDSTNAVNTVPIRQSGASSNGWLSSTDWNTFNSKAPGVTFTTGYIPFGQGTTTLNQDAGLFWNNTTKRLGVGNTAPSTPLQVTALSSGAVVDVAYFHNSANNVAASGVNIKLGASLVETRFAFIQALVTNGTNGHSLLFGTQNAGASPTEKLRVWASGGVSIGNTTDPGANNLSVTGSISSTSGSITIGTSGTYAAGSIYSDANWGMLIRAKQASPATAIFRFADSADVECFRIDNSNNLSLASGNLVIGTSGKGIDFSATPGTGTSELLDDYEEGTWTPNQGSGLTVVGAFTSSGTYTRVGRLVTVTGNVQGATSVACTAAGVICSNLPFNTNGKAFNGSVGVSNANQSASVVVAALDAYCGTAIAGTSAAMGFTVTYES